MQEYWLREMNKYDQVACHVCSIVDQLWCYEMWRSAQASNVIRVIQVWLASLLFLDVFNCEMAACGASARVIAIHYGFVLHLYIIKILENFKVNKEGDNFSFTGCWSYLHRKLT